MLQKKKFSRGVKTFEQNGDQYIFIIFPNYHIFLFSTALQKLQKIVTCFPEDNKLNLPSSSNSMFSRPGS